ncbi:hypothetical protein [Paenibacillus soyae]|uniref:Uncharacterized protein n=1 Tax=Paenibacillus soyae TaxID=2969249 RepID=A0A9X2MQE8_9BACL|nr:hypothetical protein [Paenibacillus soyae]MCR2804954.1 hypothetical protein [Paenibacillus soyae]
MGTKFGNVHVKTNEREAVLTAIRSMMDERTVSLPHVEGFESLMIQANLSKKVFYIAEYKPGWISILNDWFGWGESEAFGEELSSHVKWPVFTVSYFDDDLFELNIYENGSHVTGQLWCSGETRAVYELDDKEADISVLSSILGHEHIQELDEIIETENCEEAIDKLQELIQVPLWIHSDWFQDMDEQELIDQYTRYDFNKVG